MDGADELSCNRIIAPSLLFDLSSKFFEDVDMAIGVYYMDQLSPHDHSGALIMKHVLVTVTSPSSRPTYPATIQENDFPCEVAHRRRRYHVYHTRTQHISRSGTSSL